MHKQFILVVYDISNDRRRTKLHNLLLDYGTPVQYSVFECLLDEKRLVKMKNAVRRIARPKSDNVRYYSLCAECAGKIATPQGVENLGEPPAALVV